MALPPRLDYDRVAHVYDSHPYRTKQVDQELLRYIKEGPETMRLAVLDMGCGTGSQLVANRAAFPEIAMAGMDRFVGMLRQAQAKAGRIGWVQADSAAPPFRPASFDFISCQYSFHHVGRKQQMLDAVFALLRPGGRFVYTNLCPQEMADWLYYRFFPAAQVADLSDFWAPAQLEAGLRQAGFAHIDAELTQIHFEEDLRAFHKVALERATCSQLMTIADGAHTAGMRQIEQALRDGEERLPNHVCLLTVRADKAAA